MNTQEQTAFDQSMVKVKNGLEIKDEICEDLHQEMYTTTKIKIEPGVELKTEVKVEPG